MTAPTSEIGLRRAERSPNRNLRQTWPLLLAATVLNMPLLARGDVYAHWPLDDGQGGVARDLGPRMQEATIFDFDFDGLGPGGSVWVDDPVRGTVLGLGGNTAWVSAGLLPAMDLQNNFSWSFWARQPPGQMSPSNDIILGNRWDASGTNTDTVPREFIKFTPNRFEYHMNGGGRNDLQYADQGFIPSNDQWIHHALVKDGNTLTYYRNGEFGNMNTLTQEQQWFLPLPFALGGQHGAETWRGYLSDVQLYASTVTQADIQNTIMPGSEVANADLYARYRLNDGAGNTVSGTGSNPGPGTIFDPTDGLGPGGSVWVDDPERGIVLGLGGNTAWVDAGEIPIMSFDQDFTWTFWARQDPDQASPANDIIIGNRWDTLGQGIDTVPREWIKFTPNRVEFHLNDSGSGDVTYNALGIPSDDEWIHHIVVKEGDQLAYYRNGELANSRTLLDPMFSPDPLPFGMGGQNGAETWQGYLSEVWLFDHALSTSEIAELSGGMVIDGIPGDYNNSGQVEQADLDLVLLNWGQQTPPIPSGWTNDLPIGAIDQEELDKVLLNWGNTAALGGPAAVPEPSTLALVLVAAGLGFGLVRRRNAP